MNFNLKILINSAPLSWQVGMSISCSSREFRNQMPCLVAITSGRIDRMLVNVTFK